MKTKLLIGVSILLMQANSINAQLAWLPLDEAVSNFPIATNISNNYLITAQSFPRIGFRHATLKLNKWNGQFWISYPPLMTEQFIFSPENKWALAMHQNEFYIAGTFNSPDRTKVGIVKWNGSAWQNIGKGIESDYLIHKEISIRDMVSYNNELFVCGQFNMADEKPVHNFVRFDGSSWKNIEINKGILNDLQLLNDSMYASGLFSLIEGKPATNLAANFNGTWYPVNSPTSNEIKGLSVFNSGLIAISRNEVFLKTVSGWQALSNQWDYEIENLGNSTEFEGKFYMAGTFRNLAGKRSHLLRWDGSKWEGLVKESDVLPSGQKVYFINKRDNELLFSGKINRFLGKDVNHIISLFPNKTVVTGKVFIDINKNCKYDPGEAPLENTILNVNNSYYTSTDINGNYSLVLDGNKKSSVKIFPGENYELKCRSETTEITTMQRDSSLILDFPLSVKPQPPVPLYSVNSASGYKARHGYLVNYTIKCNSSVETYPIELKLNYDKRLIFNGSDISPNSNKDNQLKWLIQKDGNIYLKFLVNPDSLKVGDSLHFDLTGYPKLVSGNLPEIKTLNQTVVSAYDPNEKQCDKTEMEEGENELDYHIQFQNLGNDSAVNINIVDTIDLALPVQYIRIKEYSEKHRKNVSYKVRDHAIIWSFKGIYLPSKTMSNDELSSGYISFASFLAPGLKAGDIIRNKAAIYFDYQDPVITNTAKTKIIKRTILLPNGSKRNLILFPNPSSTGKISIEFSPYLIKKVEVFDMTGRSLYSKEINTASKTDIDLDNLSQGIYIINVTHTVGSISGKLVVGR